MPRTASGTRMTDPVTAPAVTAHAATAPRGWWRRDAALYAVIGLCHLPLLLVQWQRMWQIECYRYFPFLLVAAVLLLRGRWRQLPERPTFLPSRSSVAVLVLGWLVLLAAVAVASPWLGTVAAIVSALALVLSFGRSAAVALAPAWALLWLSLPLPFRWDQRLFVWLLGWTCQGGSRLLDFWGFNHVLAGYALDVPGRQFQVEELSGGSQLVLALIAMAAVLAVWLRRGWIHGVLLVCGSLFWAVALNMAGVALIVPLAVGQGVDLTVGAARYLFDAGLFLAELLVLLSTDRLLWFFSEPCGFGPGEDDEDPPLGEPGDAREAGRPALPTDGEIRTASAAARLGLRVLAVAFLAVGGLQAATWSRQTPQPGELTAETSVADGSGRVASAATLTADTLPGALGVWTAVGFQAVTRAPDSDLGRYSLVWRYADAREEAAVSLDFPFVGWYPSARSFESRGWEIESREILAGGGVAGPVLEVRMRDASGRRGYLLVNQRTDSANVVTPPPSSGWTLSGWLSGVHDRLLSRFGEGAGQPATYKIQLLVTGDLPLDAAQRSQAQEVFQQVVERICDRVWPKDASP